MAHGRGRVSVPAAGAVSRPLMPVSTFTVRAAAAALLLAAGVATAQTTPADLTPRGLPSPVAPGPAVAPYVKVAATRIALTHVRVIDGTGAPERLDQTVVIADGRI